MEEDRQDSLKINVKAAIVIGFPSRKRGMKRNRLPINGSDTATVRTPTRGRTLESSILKRDRAFDRDDRRRYCQTKVNVEAWESVT